MHRYHAFNVTKKKISGFKKFECGDITEDIRVLIKAFENWNLDFKITLVL